MKYYYLSCLLLHKNDPKTYWLEATKFILSWFFCVLAGSSASKSLTGCNNGAGVTQG